MTELRTRYLGRELRSPLVASASPLSDDLDGVRRMEDAGMGAVVLHSLFEEELRTGRLHLHHHLTAHTDVFAEATSFFPEPEHLSLGGETYLEHLQGCKEAVDIPVVASLNGTTPGPWVEYAAEMEQAGADAIELNLYHIPTEAERTAAEVEAQYLDVFRAVNEQVQVPVAVKLSPFFTNLAHVAQQLDEAGAASLVLFNRFYQPDIDLEELEVRPNVVLSTPSELRLPLRWIAILHGRLQADLAATTGVHHAEDVLKLVMAGASVTMMCSALMIHGIEHAAAVERDLVRWMEEHEYPSLDLMRGSMSLERCEDPSAFERAQYVKVAAGPVPFQG